MEDEVTSQKYIVRGRSRARSLFFKTSSEVGLLIPRVTNEDTEAQKSCLPAQGHTATRWQSRDLNCGPLTPFYMLGRNTLFFASQSARGV